MTRGKIFSFATMMVSAQRRHAAKLAAQAAAPASPAPPGKPKPARALKGAPGSTVATGERQVEVVRKPRPGVPWLQLT